MKSKLLILTAAALALSACAKKPESIDAAYISPLEYRGMSCEDLEFEASRVSVALGKTSQHQDQARTNDIMGVLILGFPVSTMSGDNVASQVGELKGREKAINEAMKKQDCGIYAHMM